MTVHTPARTPGPTRSSPYTGLTGSQASIYILYWLTGFTLRTLLALWDSRACGLVFCFFCVRFIVVRPPFSSVWFFLFLVLLLLFLPFVLLPAPFVVLPASFLYLGWAAGWLTFLYSPHDLPDISRPQGCM